MKTINYHIYIFTILVLSSLSLSSCKKEEVIIPPIINIQNTEYLKFDVNKTNDLTVTQNEKNNYSIVTTGTDPYIMCEGIKKPLHQDSVVLTFAYKCSSDIDRIQLFFGPEIREDRSLFGSKMSATTVWKNYSVNLIKELNHFTWGDTGDFLRLDFGTNSGVKIDIKDIYFRSMNDSEKKIYEDAEYQIKEDEKFQQFLSTYLNKQFDSVISEVNVGTNDITVSGKYNGEGKFYLQEICPFDTLGVPSNDIDKILIDNNPFRITLSRKSTQKGLEYDRLLSKWVIIKESNNSVSIESHARYADIIATKQSMSPGILKNKKGLGGFFMNNFVDDLDQLGITSITINIPITAFIYSYQAAGTIPYKYGSKQYYISTNYLQHIDNALKLTASKNIVVAAIILVQKASECADPKIGNILQHPNYTSEGIYTMPNLTSNEGLHCYAAALDFLATRYNRSDNAYGRIHKWILHNEVDAGLTWTNMGRKPMLNYLDTYVKSMRICYYITRQYDQNSEVMGSFTHSWVDPVELYSSKEMLTALQQFSNVEGDFQWGVAYHPYPQDLNEPKTWNDERAIFSSNSPLVTFKNLEVIDQWIKQADHYYKGSFKRSLWLSENGTNSRTYEEKDLQEQAAGFTYAWKKLNRLDGIDAIQWHNWIDNRTEFGLRIGLRRFPDDTTDPGGPKPVWHAYKAAGTEMEDAVFDTYKPIIGISNWDEIFHDVSR